MYPTPNHSETEPHPRQKLCSTIHAPSVPHWSIPMCIPKYVTEQSKRKLNSKLYPYLTLTCTSNLIRAMCPVASTVVL